MYSVCIADDERYIRKSIEQRIEHSGLPVLITGMGENGVEAWELYHKEHPDIFFVDIRMPVRDGLSMIEKIKAESTGSKTKFVIISGYDDFAYMQKAIQLGVVDYIKKPIVQEEFENTLRKICARIDRERMDENQKRTMGRLVFWRDFYETYKTNTVSGTFLLIQQRDVMEPEKIRKLKMEFSTEIWKYLWFHATNHVILLYTKERQQEPHMLKQVAAVREKGMQWQIYSGDFSPDQLLGQMEAEVCKRFYPGRSWEKNGPGTLQDMDSEKEWSLKKLEIALSNSRENGYRKLLESESEVQFQEPGRCAATGKWFRGVLMIMANVYAGYRLPLPDEITNYFLPMALADFSRKETLVDFLMYKADQLNTAVREQQEKNEIVENVVQYIWNHYQEELTLTGLAHEFFLAPTYLARKFRNKKNISVMQFLEECRIRKAAELLKESELSITEVAGQVGYTDTNYFSRVFKKVHGKTPKDYRRDG